MILMMNNTGYTYDQIILMTKIVNYIMLFIFCPASLFSVISKRHITQFHDGYLSNIKHAFTFIGFFSLFSSSIPKDCSGTFVACNFNEHYV